MATTAKKHRKAATTRLKSHRIPEDFTATMFEVAKALPRRKRLFSKIIHTSVASWAGDLLSATIARPNALLFGAIASFTLTLAAYLLSKNLGYSLSGSEPIITFLLGWAAGIIFDFLSFVFKKQ